MGPTYEKSIPIKINGLLRKELVSFSREKVASFKKEIIEVINEHLSDMIRWTLLIFFANRGVFTLKTPRHHVDLPTRRLSSVTGAQDAH